MPPIVLTRDAILAAEDLPRELVDCPEWGGALYVRTMTAGERDGFEREHKKSPDRDVRARLVAFTACDAEGRLVFKGEDIAALSRKSCKPLDRLASVALELNRITKEDVEDLEKN